MSYLVYYKLDGSVINISEEIPTVSDASYGYCKTDFFNIGDEIEYHITVSSVDPDSKDLLGYSAIRNNAHAKRLLAENIDLKQRLSMSEEVIDFILMGGV